MIVTIQTLMAAMAVALTISTLMIFHSLIREGRPSAPPPGEEQGPRRRSAGVAGTWLTTLPRTAGRPPEQREAIRSRGC